MAMRFPLIWDRETDRCCRLGDVINSFRERLDLERISATVGPGLVDALRIPVTYCWSPALIPKAMDWAEHIGLYQLYSRFLTRTVLTSVRCLRFHLPRRTAILSFARDSPFLESRSSTRLHRLRQHRD
jgi:hypothetical protein